jgi:hypothetical protein
MLAVFIFLLSISSPIEMKISSEKTLQSSTEGLKEWATKDKEAQFNQPFPRDDDFAGPTDRRSCTDAISLVILCIASLICAGLCLYGRM